MSSTLHHVPFHRADGSPTSLAEHEGKVMLVINVASACGLTPQYSGLEAIYEKYRDRGFVIVGFPCNDFGEQEPGSADEIHAFCTSKYGVQFPVVEKISVAPGRRHPLYRELVAAQPRAQELPGSDFRAKLKSYGIEVAHPEDITWNFEKFLVDRTGHAIARFAPDVPPDHPLIARAIEASLTTARVRSRQDTIITRDGSCPSYIYHPVGEGPWPAVLVFMDGLGIRPAMLELGERLASYGYFVLLPDLFYRSGPYEPMDPHTVFTDPEKRKILMEKFFALATSANIMSDTRSFLDYLSTAPDAKRGGIGTTGYCMGGLMSLTAAGTYPERIAAAASYHGGRLATDAPDSPHLLAPRIKARVFVGGAIEDPSFPDDMKQRLSHALTTASVDHEIETFDAKHGWVFRDTPVYDAAAAERHWETMIALFNQTLRD